jgi:hypothetical protein
MRGSTVVHVKVPDQHNNVMRDTHMNVGPWWWSDTGETCLSNTNYTFVDVSVIKASCSTSDSQL